MMSCAVFRALVPAPALTPEAYARCFRSYQARSGERAAMLAWLRQAPAFRPLRRHRAAILSVGCGPGDFDLKLLRMIARRYSALSYVGLEPNARHRCAFSARLACSPLPRVQCSLHAQAFENYSPRRRFDYIFLTHCLYYLPDRDQAIRRALSLLRAGGRLIIFNQTPRGIDALQRRFLRLVKGRDDERFSSRDLKTILDRRGISYRLEQLPNLVDVSACFQPRSRAGLNLLSFFLECDARHLPPQLRQAVLNRLKALCRCRQRRWFMTHPMAVCVATDGGGKQS